MSSENFCAKISFMKIRLQELFWISVKIGALLLGGGYVILPLLKSELIEKRNWIKEDELIDLYALAQCLPGIIAPNTIMFVGYKLRKKTGALVCALGLALAPFLAILALIAFIGAILKYKFVTDLFWGVNVAVVILIYLTVMEMRKPSIVDKSSFLLFVCAFLAAFLGASPSIIIIFAVLIGLCLTKIKGVAK